MQTTLATASDFAGTQAVPSARARPTVLSPGGFLAVAALVCAALWACIWAYIVCFPMAYLDRDYPLLAAKAQLAAACPTGNIAVFGDSRAIVGVIPAQMDMRVTNLATPGASPIEEYFMVRRLLRCPTPPKLVVIAQSAGMYAGPHAFWSIYAHMGVLKPAELRQVTADAARLQDDFLEAMPHPRGVPYSLLPSLYGVRFPSFYFANLIGGYGFARYHYNRVVLRNIVHDSGHMTFGDAPRNDEIADEGRMENWQVTPVTNDYLRRMLALLASHHVPVAIVTMPMNQATCQHLSPLMQPRLTAYLASIARDNPNVVLADSAIACWPDTDFNDNAHFNLPGAIAYTKQFQATLKQLAASANMRNAVND